MPPADPGASILVVDDTIENLRLLSAMLAEHGFDVRPVTRGRQALSAAAQKPPDLILLDITMPEMNGFEVCAHLKAEPVLRDIPIIFLTALTDTSDKIKAFEAGGADYITKPFNIDEVLARVNVHLALRRARLELIDSYERLRALERLRDDLVHMVVHDMRSPLTAMLGLLDLVRMEAAGQLSEQAADDFQSICDSAATLSGMANDLLDVSRLEDRKLPLDVQPHDLVALAGRVRAALAGWARGRSIEIEADGSASARCDGAVMQRVLTNLVNNAIKHTPKTGRIWMRVSCDGVRARVAVHDEGAGVPMALRQRIFEKFGTVTSRQDQSYHSAGLGLAFCRLAVEAHGGTIGVDSGEPLGSVFWFEWPA